MIQRQAVVHPDRSVFAYAVRGVVAGPDGQEVAEESVEHLVDAVLRTVDLARIAGTRPLVVRATHELLAVPGVLDLPHGMILEVPAHHQHASGAVRRLAALTDAAVRVSLADYAGDPVQDALLPYAHLVKVDSSLPPHQLTELVQRASTAGAVVVADKATTRPRVTAALEAGAELLQGPLVLQRQPPEERRTFGAGEIQCFELLRQLSEPQPDPAAYSRTVESDPELSIRVLHLVNSSASGVRHKVDSVQLAVMMVGPRRLTALATAALVGTTPTSMETLWFLLTRAHACGALGGDDTAYTVGLLSAVAAHLRMPVGQLVARTGVSAAVTDALENHGGRYGQVLAAVLAQEENDTESVNATGLDAYEVGRAYLEALPQALSLATRLAQAA